MDVFLILLGLVILCGVAYIVFKLSNNSHISLEESHEKKSEELKQMKNILSLEFKNLANEIFEDKSKKFSSNNKEAISTILDPLKERIQNFENKIEKSNQANSEWNGRLQEQIKSLKELNLQMSKEAELIFNKISADELVKFLNSHSRLGMTDEQQKEYVRLIDVAAEKIARKIMGESGFK